MATGSERSSTIVVPTVAPSSCYRKQASRRPNSEFPARLLTSVSSTSLTRCLTHHTLDIGGFGSGIGLTIRLMFGGKSCFEPLVRRRFPRMRAQIVPERQPLPHLSIRLRHMHMVGAP